MNSLHPMIEDSRINIARHEFAHAFLAHELGFFVEGITLEDHPDRHAGCTDIVYPMTCDTFSEQYAKSPRMAAAWVAQILAVIRAGSYVEVHADQVGWEPRGRDLDHIQAWREAALEHYGSDGWIKLYSESFRGLKTWFANPGVRAVFRQAAPCIAQQNHVGRYQFLDVLALAGADTCPPPHFECVLPAPRRQTAPVQLPSLGAAIGRRAEPPTIPTRASQDAQDDDDELLFSNEVPVREDAERRYYLLQAQGDLSLFRFEAKATRRSVYVLGQEIGRDRQGLPEMRRWEFSTETSARRQMLRMASRQAS